MNVDIQLLKDQRKSAKASITRISTWVLANLENNNEQQFKTRIDPLKEAYARYNNVQDQTEMFYDINTNDEIAADTEDRNVELKYFDTLSSIM